MKSKLTQIILGINTASALSCAGASQASTHIPGAGATFPSQIYSQWAEAYTTNSGVSMIYQSIGSGGGLKLMSA